MPNRPLKGSLSENDFQGVRVETEVEVKSGSDNKIYSASKERVTSRLIFGERKMKLTYRGVDYDYNPPMLEVTDSAIVCQYRGHTAPYTYVRHVPIPQMAERLTYRGVAYQTTRQGGIQQLSQSAQAPARAVSLAGLRNKLGSVSPAAQARRELLQEASQLHKESISRSLQHRIEVAKAQGNQRLIEQLESEMRQTV